MVLHVLPHAGNHRRKRPAMAATTTNAGTTPPESKKEMGILKDIGKMMMNMTGKVNPDQPHQVNQNTTRRQMRIKDIMPNFRCSTYGTGQTFVEVPYQYASYLPADMARELREIVRQTIHELIRRHGKPGTIFDERADDGTEASTAGMIAGYLIPLESWDFVSNQKVENWQWREISPPSESKPVTRQWPLKI